MSLILNPCHGYREFRQYLNEKIDLTLAGIRISFQQALALHQSSKEDVEHNPGELAKRIDSVAVIRDEQLLCNTAIEQAFQQEFSYTLGLPVQTGSRL